MPFPSDEQLMQTAGDLVAQFQAIFGQHPGFRPGLSFPSAVQPPPSNPSANPSSAAHAKGFLLNGTFTPSAHAQSLSCAPHFTHPSSPITIRFSNSTGLPTIPDADPNADPRGIAVRFHLGPRRHTDIIAHSTPFFPARTGADMLAFLQAAATSPPDAPHPTPIESLLSNSPAVRAFVTAPKPAPSSYARAEYYSLHAFHLVSREGNTTTVRYRISPDLGLNPLDEAARQEQGPDYLQTELDQRLRSGPVTFRLMAQVAEDGDVTDDVTIHWPDTRPLVELGRIAIARLQDKAESRAAQQQIIFDPIPRVEGVTPSDDPLLEMRAAVYLLSGKQRRAAATEVPTV